MRRLGLLMLAGALACRNVASLPDTLVVFAERDVEGLDPHTSGQVWQTQMLLANVYESLVSLDAQMVPRPALAVSWSNPDDFTWEFEIRPGSAFIAYKGVPHLIKRDPGSVPVKVIWCHGAL